MIYVDNKGSNNPAINLALEEYVMRKLPHGKDLFLLYINSPSIIVGKNQNVFEEVNHKVLRHNLFPVIRRNSGGGTVYHDLGNVNFSFITDYDFKKFNNYKAFNSGIVEFLNFNGVPAEFNDRGDIVIGERKISGNAQFNTNRKILSHGTLLYNSDLNALNKSIDVSELKVESQSTKSHRSTVVNIIDYMYEKIDINFFVEKLKTHLLKNGGEVYKLSSGEWAEVEKLSEEKFSTWEWNIARSPKSVVAKRVKLKGKEFKISLLIEEGLIKEIKNGSDEELFNKLLNLPYDYMKLKNSGVDFKIIESLF